MMSPGRSRLADTFSLRCPSSEPTRRRAGGSCTASKRFRMRSACSCCSADNAALTNSTLPTRNASSGEPSSALANAPVASSGVIGSDRLVRISSAKSRTSPHDAAVESCSTRTGGSFCHHADDSSDCSSRGRGSSRWTSATGRPCQSWLVSGSGSGSRKTFAPATESEPQAGGHAGVDRCRTASGHTGNQHQCAEHRSRGRQPDGSVGGGARSRQRMQHTPGAGQVRHQHVSIPRRRMLLAGARRS